MIEITDAERAIMNTLWRHSPQRSSEIYSQVAADRAWHPKTVNTLIRRLVDKGAVTFSEAVGGYRYTPLISRDDYRSREARRLVTELFDGQLTPLLASYVTAEKLSKSDLSELRKLVARLS